MFDANGADNVPPALSHFIGVKGTHFSWCIPKNALAPFSPLRHQAPRALVQHVARSKEVADLGSDLRIRADARDFEPIAVVNAGHRGRHVHRMAGGMIEAQSHPRMISGDCLRTAGDGVRLGALDIHLDEIHLRQVEFGDEFVDGGERNVDAVHARPDNAAEEGVARRIGDRPAA